MADRLDRRDAFKLGAGAAVGVIAAAAGVSPAEAGKQVNPEAERIKRVLKPESLVGDEVWRPSVYFSNMDGANRYRMALAGTSVRQMNRTIVGSCMAVEINDGLLEGVDFDSVIVRFSNNGNKKDAEKYPEDEGYMILSREQFKALVEQREGHDYRSAFFVLSNNRLGADRYSNVFFFPKTEIPPSHYIGAGGIEVTFMKNKNQQVMLEDGSLGGVSSELQPVLKFLAYDLAGKGTY